MLGQLAGAQLALDRAIGELLGNPVAAVALSESQAQRSQIETLLRQVASADPQTLSALRAEIAAAISASETSIQQGQRAANAAEAPEAILAHAADAARTRTDAIMHGMRDFDPYLQFASPEDEAEYRAREAERRAYIEAQQARGTPEGDLNAAGAATGQMLDAAAHGADQSPEWHTRMDELLETTANLREQIRRNGGSTQEFDDNLRVDLRQFLKAKGLSDAQIDAAFATHADPLEVARTYIASEADAQQIDGFARNASESSAPSLITATAPQGASMASINDAVALLQAAGATVTEPVPEHEFAHGVAAHSPNISEGINRS